MQRQKGSFPAHRQSEFIPQIYYDTLIFLHLRVYCEGYNVETAKRRRSTYVESLRGRNLHTPSPRVEDGAEIFHTQMTCF